VAANRKIAVFIPIKSKFTSDDRRSESKNSGAARRDGKVETAGDQLTVWVAQYQFAILSFLMSGSVL
jgi:hypothetical protein